VKNITSMNTGNVRLNYADLNQDGVIDVNSAVLKIIDLNKILSLYSIQ